ncbi:chaperone of endosialidase [Bacteriophage sp.]|nr:chaperone of endosialidase [Bacteriophage sp.]
MVLKVAGGGGGTAGAVNYLGTWNASTNTPTLASGVGTKGGYYVVSVAGTTNLDGISLWSVGDWAVFNGSVWQKVDGSSNEAFASITVTGLTGYMYGNNTSPVTASTTIPNTAITGLGTMSTQNANAVVITGGTINSTTQTNGTYANANITSVAATFPNSYLANSNVVIGNTTVALGSTATSVGNLTLANATISSGNATFTNANATNSTITNLSSGNVTLTGGTQNNITYTNVTISSGNATFANVTSTRANFTNTFLGYTATTAAAGTTVLTLTSTYWQKLVASGGNGQTFQLPNATTLPNGAAFVFDNDSGGTLTIVDNASATVDTMPAGTLDYIFLEDNSTAAGSWGKYSWNPASYNFSTNTADFGTANITNATWTATTIGAGYGGTGVSSITANAVVIGNGTNAVITVSPGSANNALISNGTNWVSQALPASGVTITDDTSSNATRYVTLTANTTGTITGENVSSTKLYFNPNSGTMSALQMSAENGIFINKNTVSANVTVGTGYNAVSAGPVTVANGVSVTVASGSRWVVA